MGVNDIGPDHGALTVLPGDSLNSVDVLEIESTRAQFLVPLLRLPPAEIPGLVAVGIEPMRPKERQVFVVEISKKGQRSRMTRSDGPAAFGFRHGPICGQFEDMLHVPEGLKAGNEFHEALGRVGLERREGPGIEWARVSPDSRMFLEAERMLGIKHEHIQLEDHTGIDQFLEALSTGNLAPRDVEHDASHAQVGAVLDSATGNPAARPQELKQGFDPVAEPGSRCTADLDVPGLHRKTIRIVFFAQGAPLAQLFIHDQIDSGRPRRS